MSDDSEETPVQIEIDCPKCGQRHVDFGKWAVTPHKTHQCQFCSHEWRPYEFPNYGVQCKHDWEIDITETLTKKDQQIKIYHCTKCKGYGARTGNRTDGNRDVIYGGQSSEYAMSKLVIQTQPKPILDTESMKNIISEEINFKSALEIPIPFYDPLTKRYSQ